MHVSPFLDMNSNPTRVPHCSFLTVIDPAAAGSWKLIASKPATLLMNSQKHKKKIASEWSACAFQLANEIELTVLALPNCDSGKTLTAVMKVITHHCPFHDAKGVRLITMDTQLNPSRVSASCSTGWTNPQNYFMPQRVALRIYWQAIKLIMKGV